MSPARDLQRDGHMFPEQSRFAVNACISLRPCSGQCQITAPLFDPIYFGLDGPNGANMIRIEMSTPHSFRNPVHTIILYWYCTVWPQYITRQTDSDRNRLTVHGQEHRLANKESFDQQQQHILMTGGCMVSRIIAARRSDSVRTAFVIVSGSVGQVAGGNAFEAS